MDKRSFELRVMSEKYNTGTENGYGMRE
jgi:hypothetical protein